jgi:hypothetical protein
MLQGASYVTGTASGGKRLLEAARQRRMSRLVMAAVTVAALTAGCSAQEPAPAPPVAEVGESQAPAATPTPTRSPTPMPAQLPERAEAMEAPDRAGAEAAATYFLELFNYVMTTGQVAEWQAISGASCGFCANTVAEVEKIYGSGGSYQMTDYNLGTAEVVAFDETFKVFGVEVPYESGGATIFGPAGERVDVRSADHGSLLLEVGFVPGEGWQLLTGGTVGQ